ncbi:YqjF family protein [Kineococcus sp. SYSU DK018]|uniref:YqjF family protein n=1 Tax=Kineococcus sp. SYSU DK018 TaxID=3383139 RepID=UPI003D7D4000
MIERLPSPTAPPLAGAVMMHQHWDDVAFLHWAVDPARVAPHLPPGARPDVLDGVTYVGLLPFTLRGAAAGELPAVPHLGTFLETNVRFYSVDDAGRRGVVFASLDASRLAVVLGARVVFALPYRWSLMRHAVRVRGGARELLWTCRTRAGASSRVVVREGGPLAAPDDVATFVSARYGLHVARRGRTRWIANEHEPWPLRTAELLELDDGLLGAAGFGDLDGRAPDHVAFARRVTTRFALPRELGRTAPR